MKEVYMNIDAFNANYRLGREMLWRHVNVCVGLDIRKRDKRIAELEAAEMLVFQASEAEDLHKFDHDEKDKRIAELEAAIHKALYCGGRDNRIRADRVLRKLLGLSEWDQEETKAVKP